MKIVSCLAGLTCCATLTFAQNPLSGGQKAFYGMVSANIVAAAEKMPEADYGFKPVDTVRSFGELVGHAADAQGYFCSTAAGEKSPLKGVGKSTLSKPELVKAVKDAVAYCEAVYSKMTDEHATEMVKFMGMDAAKLTVLTVNTAHLDEHYGNMVTYMRIKGLVPPSSEPKK